MNRLTLSIAGALLALLALAPPAAAAWTWPVRGDVITVYRNGADAYAAGQHRGIDIAGPVGAAVVAAAAGEVRFAGVAGSSGLTISVRTADGRFDTSYLHLSSGSVREGEQVALGERLGAVGTSGRRSAEASHLHFGIREAGSRQAYHDPLELLPPPPATTPEPQPAPPLPAPVPLPMAEPVRTASPQRGPVRVPSGAPRRVPAPVPRRAPVARRHRVPSGAPRRAPVFDPRRAPVLRRHRVPGGADRRAPAAEPRRAPVAERRWTPASAPRRTPGDARGRLPAAEPQRRPEGAPRRLHGASGDRKRSTLSHGIRSKGPSRRLATADPRQRQQSPESSGPDRARVLACLGLLAAAALVGTSGGERSGTSRGEGALRRVLGPLLGRG